MIGSCSNSGDLAHGLHRLVAVHLRHHDVHQDEVDVRVRAERLDPVPAVLGEDDLHAVRLEHGGEREDVAHVVVDDQHLLALEHRLGAVELLEHAPLRLRQPRLDAVEEERRLVEQPLRRARVLDDDRLGVLLQPRLLAARELLARVDDHRQPRVALVLLQLLEQLEARRLRQLQVEHHAVERRCAELLERLVARADRGHLDVVAAADELDERVPLVVVVLDDEQAAGRCGR